MTLVDSHCHLNFQPLHDNLDTVLANARDNGVAYMLCVSVTLETFPEIRVIAGNHSHIYASVGVHPNERDGREPTVDELARLADDERVVAIGETGLDYFRSRDDAGDDTGGSMEWQLQRFRNHIQAARRARKPLIIHTREAADDTLRLMREEGAQEPGGVMHCFTESWDVAKQALDLGFYISLSGIVTFRNAEALREVAKKVPEDRLLVETDSPYLAPVPHRGKSNEPAFVRNVAEFVAGLRGVSFETLADQTTRNFFTLFRAAVPN
ncbi:MAG TPA: TatD family hydrolase [Burkholderiales bacterium]|nr:TatD family hydrolase [Burkholderiales bacterium]